MRTTLRIVAPLIVSVAVVSLLFATYQVRTQKRILRNDLSRRADILAESLQTSVEPLFDREAPGKGLQRLVDRFGKREQLKGVAVYDANGVALAMTSALGSGFQLRPAAAAHAAERNSGYGEFIKVTDNPVHVYAVPLHRNGQLVGTLALVHDTSYIDKQVAHTMRDSMVNALIQTLFITGLALILVRWAFTDPLKRTAKWLRTLRTGQLHGSPPLPEGEVFDQIHNEVTRLARDLNAARATAEEEARLRESHASLWTAERLRVSLSNKLHNKPLFVIANREPYMHVYNNGVVQAIVPASGLVTALEPVLVATDGTWIANGSGNADRETVDAHDRLRVPPEQPRYTLRRVWLSAEEEKGYYEGFANSALWPALHSRSDLIHVSHDDYQSYCEVNAFMARALLRFRKPETVFWVQDYHFLALGAELRDLGIRHPIGFFLHTPWPGRGIIACVPHHRQLVEAMLAYDLIGFQTDDDRDNFLGYLRSDLGLQVEGGVVTSRYGKTRCAVFPIGIDPEKFATHAARAASHPDVSRLRRSLNGEKLAIGVDRVDYSKGLVNRIEAFDQMLTLQPALKRTVSLLQIATLSRGTIEAYGNLQSELARLVGEVNGRHGEVDWTPIRYLNKGFSQTVLAGLYRAAQVGIVTPLHDGMNLVAKEYVAAQNPSDPGVLVLSKFAGAANELDAALLVNPHDIHSMAGSIATAFSMPLVERQMRWEAMMTKLRAGTIQQWFADFLEALQGAHFASEEPASGKVGLDPAARPLRSVGSTGAR